MFYSDASVNQLIANLDFLDNKYRNNYIPKIVHSRKYWLPGTSFYEVFCYIDLPVRVPILSWLNVTVICSHIFSYDFHLASPHFSLTHWRSALVIWPTSEGEVGLTVVEVEVGVDIAAGIKLELKLGPGWMSHREVVSTELKQDH